MKVWLCHQSSGWQEAFRVRFVCSTAPPPLTALRCQETLLERQAVGNCWSNPPRRLKCYVFSAAHHFVFLFSANYKLRPFSIQYTLKLPPVENHMWSVFCRDVPSWLGFFLSLALQKSAHLNFKTWGSAMIKFSARRGMFWWHRGFAIRCFVLMIVVHNELCTLKTATRANNLCCSIVVTFQAKKVKCQRGKKLF